jgi:hypothetical protein
MSAFAVSPEDFENEIATSGIRRDARTKHIRKNTIKKMSLFFSRKNESKFFTSV